MRTESLTSLLRRAGFTDPERAKVLSEGELASLHVESFVSEFARVADPDQALLALARLTEEIRHTGTIENETSCDADLQRILADTAMRSRLLALLGMSSALGDFLISHTSLLTRILQVRSIAGLEEMNTSEEETRSEVTSEIRTVEYSDEGDVRIFDTQTEVASGACEAIVGEKETERRLALEALGADPKSPMPVARLTGRAGVDALRTHYFTRISSLAAFDLTSEDPRAVMPAVGRAIAGIVGASLEAGLALARAEIPEARKVGFTVIALGKTGAEELNYISDVDVIFLARSLEPGQWAQLPKAEMSDTKLGEEATKKGAAGAHVQEDELESSEPLCEARMLEIASAIATHLTRTVSAPAGEPALWMLDGGLRPEGKDGPLVRTLASHVAYYKRWAQSWEFQALLKARPIAGDMELGEAYMKELWPEVWSAAGRTGFVEETRAMRARVEAHVCPREADRQIKLGKGGLRDIEFSIQLLQLVHGRTDESLRKATTLNALAALREGGYVARKDALALGEAYRFLRLLEHRIQLQRLRRSHLLPASPVELRRVARSLGISDIRSGEELNRAWQETRTRVRALHKELYYRPLLPEAAKLSPDDISLGEEAARERLGAIGYKDPRGAVGHIRALTNGISRTAAIQRQLLPVMLGWFAEGANPDQGLLEFRLLSEKMGRTSWYMRTLRDGGAVAQRLSHILASSRFTAEHIRNLPESVVWLTQTSELTPVPQEKLEAELASLLARREEPHDIVEAGRYLRRRELLRTSMAQGLRLITPEQSRRALSSGADVALNAALQGATRAVLGKDEAPSRYLLVAMGRLGGMEMGYASDADVIFLHEPREDADLEQAERIAVAIASQVASLLSEANSELPLTVDYALRPEGKQGVLVRSLSSYQEYFQRWAHMWERQALLRARPVAGNPELAQRYLTMVAPWRYPDKGLNRAERLEILRMKARMEHERIPRGIEPTRHLKLGPGGICDVEWTAQLLQLEHAGAYPKLRTTSTIAALKAAAQEGILSDEDEKILTDTWRRACELRDLNLLATGRTQAVKVDVLAHSLEELAAIAALDGREPSARHDIEEEYLRAARRSRRVVERVFFGREQDE